MTEVRQGSDGPGPGRSPGRAGVLVCAGFLVCAFGVLRAAPAAQRVVVPSTTARSGLAGRRDARTTRETTTTATAATTIPSPSTTTTVDLGALPQTDARPSTQTAAFETHAASLWQAVVHDDPDVALAAFFPRLAYRQVKDVSDPDADWQGRLIANFRVDVHALHQQLGADAAAASFERLDVPDGAAEWIQPGVEFNKGSYWRVLGSRLLYTVGGQERSLPVTSLISWRGEWYVVHLGAIR